MSEKGDQTRKLILDKARERFAKDGFCKVTMKDICEATGLSRGGLYRHYDSTAMIFEEMFSMLAVGNQDRMEEKISAGVPAADILKEALAVLKEEIMSKEDSLSLAIYEYAGSVDSGLFEKLNEQGIQKWTKLIEYGIERQEFQKVDVSAVVTMLTYAYQGIRMWSRVIKLPQSAADDYENGILRMLFPIM